jgi:hypothetical protein
MAAINNITTGEQTVAAAGAVTGSLDTSALNGPLSTTPGSFTIKLRVRGLSSGKRAIFAIEDTANATPFSDAVQVAVCHVEGGMPTDGTSREWQSFEIPGTRFGVTNSALRLNCLSISATPGTVKAHAWLEQ